MKNVVICQINSKYIHSSLASWYLYAGVKEYCKSEISAFVCDGTINENILAIADRICSRNPDILGLCCYIWNIKTVKQLIPIIKSRIPDCVIALGGPEVSYCAEEILSDEPLVDYVLSGEGERTFAQLSDALNGCGRLDEISGLCRREKGKILLSPPNIEKGDPVNPYCEEYFAALNGRIAYLETSRGCPFSCAFCLSGRCGNVRFFDIQRAKRDILRLAASGSKTIKLVDRTFNANKKRAFELFSFIKENYGGAIPCGVCFHFEIAGDILSDDMINLLQSMPKGAVQLEIGLQSFNENTLCSINRKTDMPALKRNILLLLKNNNIHIHIDLIAGLPLEDINSFANSFNEAYAMKPHMLQFGFLKLLHGSPMREQPKEYPCSFNNEPPYEVNSTPYISQNELKKLHRIEDVFDRLYNSGRFRRSLDYLLGALQETPFELFSRFAENCSISDRSLYALARSFFEYFCSFDCIEKSLLRDALVTDLLCVNQSGKLPDFLKAEDDRLKQLRLFVNQKHKPPKGIKRAFAILYGCSKGMYVDYDEKDSVTGEYAVNLVELPKSGRPKSRT